MITAAACATLLAAGTPYAGTRQTTPGQWTRETRTLGNKVTIDIYRHDAPYALTGDAPAAPQAPSGKWTRETRQVGNKVTIDVYRR
jgi:hypothetical protein